MIIEILLVGTSVVVAVGVSVIGYGIGQFNTFRVGQQDIQTQWSNILTEYQRRADMFYNLVESVKSSKKFEKETLVEVAKARGGNFGSGKESQMKNLKGLDGMFQRLMLVFERYPKLKSTELHDKLMEEIRITEDRINVARTQYNEIVGDYNKMIQMFPSNIIAGMFKFDLETFFKNEDGTTSSPKIKLE